MDSSIHTHGHIHGHTHDHANTEQLSHTPQWRIGVAIGLGLVTVITQIIVGILSGSLALLSDSAHAFTDVSVSYTHLTLPTILLV